MRERGIRQEKLAHQTGISQGHLSKVLRDLPMGRRTEGRLRQWLREGDEKTGPPLMTPEELRRLGVQLKQQCEQLASLSGQVEAEAFRGGERGS
jgi:transcriptional regulator with XRE-family HTH domain